MNAKEKFFAVLKGADRFAPVFVAPGGLFISTPDGMDASLRGAKGLPYRMTVESEAYGGEREIETFGFEAGEYEYPLSEVGEFLSLPLLDPKSSGRMPEVIAAIKTAAGSEPYSEPYSEIDSEVDLPVIADLVGPVSLATSLVDTRKLLKSMLSEPEAVHSLLRVLTDGSIGFLRELIHAGAEVVFIMDPASNGEMLGEDLFREFTLPYLNELAESAASYGREVGTIVHICGNAMKLAHLLGELKADIISLDSDTSIRELKELLPGKRLMAGLSIDTLFHKGPVEIGQEASKLVADGAVMIAPSCGITREIPLQNMVSLSRSIQDIVAGG